MKPRYRRTACALLVAAALAACTHSPYRGEQQREIAALSADEQAALLAGHGLGFAKAAELNGYPGPLHVLELADRLGLSAAQRDASARLMAAHRDRAKVLGAELVAAERRLDRLFAERTATPDAVDAATRRIGALRAELRAEHLKTHLAQTALLDAAQVRRYAELRGYAAHRH